jgi:hypothetical protein
VLNLVVNFALFLAIGTGLGLVWRRVAPGPNHPQRVPGVSPLTRSEGEV